MKHIRITFNGLGSPTPENLLVEYGRMEVVGLTAEERLEYDELGKKFEDVPKADFAKAADLIDPKKRAEIQGRRRYAELDKKLIEPQMIWMPVDVEDTPHTILLIMQEGNLPIYVENMPPEMIQRLMEPQIHINSPQIYMASQALPATTTPPPPQVQPNSGSKSKDRIIEALKGIKEANTVKKPWEELVNIDEKNPAEGIYEGEITQLQRLYIMPVKFLGEDWRRINDVIITTFGSDKQRWKNTLKKQSHWEVVLE